MTCDAYLLSLLALICTAVHVCYNVFHSVAIKAEAPVNSDRYKLSRLCYVERLWTAHMKLGDVQQCRSNADLYSKHIRQQSVGTFSQSVSCEKL